VHPKSGQTLSSLDGQALPLQALLEQAVGLTLQGFLLTDAAGTILYANEAAAACTGFCCDEIVGRTPKLFQSGRHEAGFYEKMWRSLKETGHWQGDVWNSRKNGELYAASLTLTALPDESGEAVYYCGILTDITERKQLEQKLKTDNRMLEKLSLVDGLTGVANRRGFDRCLEREWERGVRTGQPLSLLLIDIDFFKLYNDLNGHQMGDEALRLVASLLEGGLARAGDFLARYGGEEFGVILPETELETAVGVAHSLRDRISSARIPHPGSSVSPDITISVGCSTLLPSGGGSCDKLLQAADKALYAAKERGRNRVQIRA
jgi:diguanylate cyclase (GGDEF)-like protein/PAS domain S-box-containing protein